METAGFLVREAGEADFEGWFALFESVTGEGRWMGHELPLDREEFRQRFAAGLSAGGGSAVTSVAESGARQVGQLFLGTRGGLGDLGMAVDAAWRSRGVGSALMGAAIVWSREHDIHKLALQTWPHNDAARALYSKFGFVEEGYLRRHYRRRNGEPWDAVVMGLVLDSTSTGSPW